MPIPAELPNSSDLVAPDYEGGCLSNVLPALLGRADGVPAWMPPEVAGARQVVLLVLDGVGWEQLIARGASAPALAAMTGGAITTVAPSTTAAALTSLTLGCPPGEHGLVGYRMHVGEGVLLNILRWRTGDADARTSLVPRELQPRAPFRGAEPVVVTRASFGGTGFSSAHLGAARLAGWHTASGIAVDVGRALAAEEPFVYAYYDGVDKVAHVHGLGAHYTAELAAADRLVDDLANALPAGAVLVVTSDHGQVDVGDNSEPLDADVIAASALVSGEARFRWLHAPPGGAERLAVVARDRYGPSAIVRTRDEVEHAGWLGPELTDAARRRLGDVALVATGTSAYLEPSDAGERQLVSRHGALTSAEMLVPLLAVAG